MRYFDDKIITFLSEYLQERIKNISFAAKLKANDMNSSYAPFFYFYFYFAGKCEAGMRV